MMFGLLRDMAIAPMFRVRRPVELPPGNAESGRWSVSGVQVGLGSAMLPAALRVRQTPPVAAATKMRLGSSGSAAMPETRPLVFRLPAVPPRRIGAGPIGTQAGGWSV